jgi:hypothetical protein
MSRSIVVCGSDDPLWDPLWGGVWPFQTRSSVTSTISAPLGKLAAAVTVSVAEEIPESGT